MKKHHDETTGAPAVLLADRGERSRELGAVFMALAHTRFGGDQFTLEELGDVEDLLLERNGAGTLILESGRVPAEDIGFVRRFLERSASWKLLVLGEDAQDSRSRGLLALPRSQWLPWPPDLEQLAALLGNNGSLAPHVPPAAAATPPAPAGGPDLVSVGDFLEELLAGLSLSGAGAPSFLYRPGKPLFLSVDQNHLHQGLRGLLELARHCAGEGQVVNVTAEGIDARVRVRIDFPLGSLTDADLPGLFEGGFDGSPELAEGVEAARAGHGLLQGLGATVELLAQRPGRLRLEVLLPGRTAAP